MSYFDASFMAPPPANTTAAVTFGTAAARPAAAASNANTGYYATDTSELTLSDGSAWHQIGQTTDAQGFTSSAFNVGTGGLKIQVGSGGTNVEVINGDFRVVSTGNGLQVAEGTNCKQGTVTLAAGTVVVSNTSVTATSRIFLTIQSPGGTVGAPYVSARTAGTSFTITSTSATDTSVVAYEIFEVG